MRDAACVEHPARADDWFDARPEPTARAKHVSTACICQRECLAYALSEDIGDGLWGGATPAERRELVNSGPLTGELVARWGTSAMQGRVIERDRAAEDARWTAICAELSIAALADDG